MYAGVCVQHELHTLGTPPTQNPFLDQPKASARALIKKMTTAGERHLRTLIPTTTAANKKASTSS